MTLKKIEPRFIAGPPGTGKTHKYITKLYKELLSKYSYEKILILSHTNVAAEQILEAVQKLPEMFVESDYFSGTLFYQEFGKICNHFSKFQKSFGKLRIFLSSTIAVPTQRSR